MVQKRGISKVHEDDHYCAAIFHYLKNLVFVFVIIMPWCRQMMKVRPKLVNEIILFQA